jgi:hypothetical protein
MSTILDLVKGQLSDSHVSAIGQTIGADSAQTNSAISEALPLLLGALTKSANSNSGLTFLSSLLDKNQDGSMLDDIMGMVMGGGTGSVAPQGAAAVQAILGAQAPTVENHVAQSAGIDAGAVAKLLPILAPIVMGALAKTQSTQNLSSEGLAGFLEKESSSALSQSSS